MQVLEGKDVPVLSRVYRGVLWGEARPSVRSRTPH